MSGATDQLLRLLRIIPLATRSGGIDLAEAARLCGVSEAVIRGDVRVLTDRGGYLPPGRTDDFQVLLDGERLRIHAPPAFHRPVRLALDEMLACALALRCAGLDSDERVRILEEIESQLVLRGASPVHGSQTPGSDAAERADEVEMVLRHAGSHELADTISRGIVHGRRIRFGYVKASAEAPEIRLVEPWRMIHAEGESYLVGHDVERDGPRLFRVDRILAAEVTEEPCSASVQDEVEDHRSDGTVRMIVGDLEERWATVRYSPRVARWVRERYDGEEEEHGAYTVRHQVLSEDWIVRHVLSYGVDAEVLEPEELRTRMLEHLMP